MNKKAQEATYVSYPKYQIFEFETDRLLSPEVFADKDSAQHFGEAWFSHHDYMIEDRSSPPVVPAPPPMYDNNVICLASFRNSRQVKVLS